MNDGIRVVTRDVIADVIDEETGRASAEILRRYGPDYYRAWLAGRRQATEEIRSL